MHRLMSASLVAGLVLVVAAGTAWAIQRADDSEFGLLVPGRGAEETFLYCTPCHSEMIVAQQGLTREGWIESLQWMVEEQGMPEIEEPDYGLVIDYLSTHYGVDRPNFPRN